MQQISKEWKTPSHNASRATIALVTALSVTGCMAPPAPSPVSVAASSPYAAHPVPGCLATTEVAANYLGNWAAQAAQACHPGDLMEMRNDEWAAQTVALWCDQRKRITQTADDITCIMKANAPTEK